jgi:hypothetical protein
MHFVHFSCCRSSVWVFFGPRPFHWDRKKKGLEMLIAQVFDNNAQKPAPRTNILFFNLAGSGKWTFDSSRYKARKCNNRDLHLAWNHNSTWMARGFANLYALDNHIVSYLQLG